MRVLSYSMLAVACVLTAAISFALYRETQEILSSQLKRRLIGLVSTAALQFSPEEISKIQDESSIGNNSFVTVTTKLQLIRNANKSIRFAYILRPTEQEGLFEFVADADSMDPYAEVDLNQDGIIDENDSLNIPGDEYDVSEIPAITEALSYPITDSDPVADQWGTFLSAYAPIKEKGIAVGVVGIDVEISDYLEIISQTLQPFLLFIGALILLLTLLTVFLVRIWKSRIEIMRELDRQKDELLGIVSHQLATPISALKWDFEMLIDGDLGEVKGEQKDFFQKLQNVTSHLSDLVSMILDVSRIQLGRMKVDRTELDLNVFFGDVLNIMETKSKERKVNLSYSIQERMGIGKLDKRLMFMITENLLSNAIKYTPEGGKVNFDTKVENNVLKFRVSDTGCGIPKQDQDKIFGKLYRASNVRSVDGNGFGLYVVKGAAEAQGGKIWFKSEENQGTTFYVELPI